MLCSIGGRSRDSIPLVSPQGAGNGTLRSNQSGFTVDNAIILAAGLGSRFAPLTFEAPKGLIPVKGMSMVERQIIQLKEKNIHNIIIVTGYLRDKYLPLIEKYNLTEIYNQFHDSNNNLSSLYAARSHLKNSYILSSDHYLTKNIFNSEEKFSWYCSVYKNGKTDEWCITHDETNKITGVTVGGSDSYVMYGPVFLSQTFSRKFKHKIEEYFLQDETVQWFWEDVFVKEVGNFELYINKQDESTVLEFESLHELRQYDRDYGFNTGNHAIEKIKAVFNAQEAEIDDFACSKSGMTNNSFSFKVHNKDYIFRLAGKGSNILINRKNEKIIYDKIKRLNISDDIIFFNEESGDRICVYWKEARNLNSRSYADLENAMRLLHVIHNAGITIENVFDVKSEIKKYRALCGERKVRHCKGYRDARKKIEELLIPYSVYDAELTLCHVDCNPDNYLILKTGEYRIIDWEYGAMCENIIDIAFFSIYSYYDEDEAVRLLSLYLKREPLVEEKRRLFQYMAFGGFLWGLWSEYKETFGINFIAYRNKMYKYAEEFYEKAKR
jgi:CTP:phosphocholine cytidylyltransferase-like protein/thiamine kinase-like enzyme